MPRLRPRPSSLVEQVPGKTSETLPACAASLAQSWESKPESSRPCLMPLQAGQRHPCPHWSGINQWPLLRSARHAFILVRCGSLSETSRCCASKILGRRIRPGAQSHDLLVAKPFAAAATSYPPCRNGSTRRAGPKQPGHLNVSSRWRTNGSRALTNDFTGPKRFLTREARRNEQSTCSSGLTGSWLKILCVVPHGQEAHHIDIALEPCNPTMNIPRYS